MGSLGLAAIALRRRAGLALEKSTDSAELPTKVVGRPSASNQGASNAWMDNR